MRLAKLTFGILILLAATPARAQSDEGGWVIIEEGSPPANQPAPAALPALPTQGKLIVTADPPAEAVPRPTVYLDGVAVGPVPWEGAVAPGAHKVRVETTGWSSRTYRESVAPGQTATVRAELLRGGEFDLGKWYVGLTYSFGVGGSYSGGDKYRLNAPGLGPGIAFGMRLPLDKLWLEAGLAAGPWTDRWIDYSPSTWAKRSLDEQVAMKKRSGQGMPIALTLRYVSPIAKPFLYWTATVEPGVLIYGPYRYDEDAPQYGYVESLQGGEARAIFLLQLRAGIALFLADWFEVRIDPLGMGMHCTKPFGVVYNPSFALVLRL